MPPALQNPVTLWLLLTAALAGLVYAFMRPELRWKAIGYGSFLLACAVAIWPPYEREGVPGRIKLGLDLRGGIHLVLQVVVEDALNATVDDAVTTARDQATRKGIQYGAVQRVSPTSFSVEGTEPARVKDMRDVLRDFFGRSWEVREAGEGKFTVAMTDLYARQVKEQTVQEAIRTLERRVNALGVAEPVIAAHGQPRATRSSCSCPGSPTSSRPSASSRRPPSSRSELVENSAATQETLLQGVGGKVPDNMELMSGPSDTPGQPTYYLLRKEAMITGRDLKNARVGVDENNRPQINFSLNALATDKFARETGRNIGRQLAIVLDGTVYSAPVIQSKLGSDNRITGHFTTQEADELSKILKAGALPATLKYLQELTVGASLGRDSIRDGVRASIAAMAFITIFMLVYYRLSGLNAIVALAGNMLIVLAAAGLHGRDPHAARHRRHHPDGRRRGRHERARLRADPGGAAHRQDGPCRRSRTASTGSGSRSSTPTRPRSSPPPSSSSSAPAPIKGFAVTLVIGLVSNVFASYFVSKFIFEWVLGKRHVESLSI